nr:MAG TPA: hypothetical protein [Caudoviricetes sp.]
MNKYLLSLFNRREYILTLKLFKLSGKSPDNLFSSKSSKYLIIRSSNVFPSS